MKKSLIFVLLFVGLLGHGQDSLVVQKRVKNLLIGSSAAYAVTMVGLSSLWYSNTNRTSFHFFNDNAQWQQIDKVGHSYTAYQVSSLGYEMYRWAGLPKKKSAVLGALTGFVFQTPIEIFDGFSAEYGASWGDLVANTIGSSLFLWQASSKNQFWLTPKFSFRRSGYASLRPNILGSSFAEQLLKDYNGQTYWLSLTPGILLPHSRLPKWLSLSFGYGADGMVFGSRQQNNQAGFDASRQLYVSLDWNLTAIPTNQKWLKTVFKVLNVIKMPAPALRLEDNRLRFLPFYF